MRQDALEAIDGYLPLVYGGIRALLLILLGYVATLIISRLIRAIREYSVRVMIARGGLLESEIQKRAATVARFVRHCLLTLLWVAITIGSLEELGFKIDALLAGAGVSAGIIGVAVGFGAQNFVKDIIAGLFLLIENQLRVGDSAVINNIGGTVEEMNLRTTVLRSENGAVHVIPNGAIQTLANLTRDFAYYPFELSLRYEHDPDRTVAVLREITSEMRADPAFRPFILDDLDVAGVDRFMPNAVILKARVKTLPTKQWMVGREINRRIRQRFQDLGMDLKTEPMEVRFPDLSRSELKALIREVLNEADKPRNAAV
jgi:small conductance mechanosensitive channel